MKNGDEKNFIAIANEIGELVQEKNEAYGDAFAKSQQVIKVLYPNGVQPEQYRDMLAITRVIDKLFRIATKKDAFGESPWRDICGYAILGIANDEADIIDKEKEENNKIPHQGEVYHTKESQFQQLQQQERLAAAITQGVRERREEGHGNPYANIDDNDDDENYDRHPNFPSMSKAKKRDVRLSYISNETIDEVINKTNAEGNKEKECKGEEGEIKEVKEIVSFDEWNSYVSSSNKTSKRKTNE